jgi:hypothetical protein
MAPESGKRGGRIRAIRSAAVRRLAPKDTARTWTESNISTDLEDQLQGQLQGARPTGLIERVEVSELGA